MAAMAVTLNDLEGHWLLADVIKCSVMVMCCRVLFRCEAAWDSSLHNSSLLNRITRTGEQIFLTISAYIDVRTHWLPWAPECPNVKN